jgi:hypothetical protein
MIKRNYTVGTSTVPHPITHKETPIVLYMIVHDVAPENWIDKKNPLTGGVVPRPETIGELKARWKGKLQGPFSHPLSKGQRFQFDLSPWAHLPDDTYLNVDWPFETVEASQRKSANT